jgi:serine/threonine-protein kinase
VTEPSGRLSGIVADRYRVDREIGQGGMAKVYLAYDQRRHDTKVAIKVLRPELASRLGGERFVREIRITAQLQHPNILPVFDSGESEGNPYFVMPYVEGETLENRLRKSGPLPIDEAVSIAAEVADALAYAHERGFVHRDVKPSNIMIAHGHAMLADFGIARAIDAATDVQLTETGLAIGTASYMSPEQSRGQPVDGRSDIYALACVLYETLAGSPPFTGSARVVLARHTADTAPSLRVVRDAVPEAVERVIFKAMAKIPADRYASAAAFRDALRQAITMQVAAVGSGPSVQRNWLALALAAAVVTAAVIAVATVWGGGGSSGALDPDRVLILPLRVSGSVPASAGSDVATLVQSALEGAGGLRSILHVDPATGDGAAVIGNDEARRVARDARAANFVTGSITPVGAERVGVALTLHETATGEPVLTSGTQMVALDDAWRGGLRAANELLAALIGGAPDISAEWLDREPGAIASFLRGEAAFRRIQLEEALGHYRDAFAQDSTFALAAIRGAVAAGWDHRAGEAAAMIETASNLPLPPRYADFARGYAAYLKGDADAAIAAFERTIADYPDMAEAWAQLGEAYTHLLPTAGDPDSIALFAFEQARRLDPTASHTLLHTIEIRIRRGDIDIVQPLLAQFLATRPDSVLAVKLDIMNTCARDGTDAVDWNGLAARKPFEVIDAAKALSVAAALPACAMAGYRALLAIDTSLTDAAASGRRWAAVLGLQSLLVASGRTGEAMAVIDSSIARWGSGPTLFMLDATVDDAFADRANEVIRDIRQQSGPYSQWTSTIRLWEVGVLEAMAGNADETDAIAVELARRVAAGATGDHALMAQSLRAHATAARGDAAGALRLLEELVPAVLPAVALTWHEFRPLAVERLVLARLLFENGDFRRAIDVANVFDSQAPLIHVLFMSESLRLRLEAAIRIGNPLMVSKFRTRLDALMR